MLETLRARKEALEARGEKGFTLMEMLIVIAIIAILVAIAIPVLSGQLENAREATDAANLRSAYAEQSVKLLEWDGKSEIADIKVKAEQTQANWQSTAGSDIGGLTNVAAVTSGSEWTVSANTANGTVTITPTTQASGGNSGSSSAASSQG